MLKVCKFGGSSLADEKQFEKVKDIVLSDPARRVVVVSAPGKRSKEDHKITDLLYLTHAHIQYGVDQTNVWQLVKDRYFGIREALSLDVDLEGDFKAIEEKMTKKMSVDFLVSRGEYFSAKLMAAYLGYKFIDSADWVEFEFSGKVNLERSYKKLKDLADGSPIVVPGFFGAMPDGEVRVMSRGGSDITGALAAAALSADVYENWTDVSGILMADPRIVENPETIPEITYAELRELSYLGAQVLHEDTIFPVRHANIPLNIRNTNAPQHPGTLIMESFEKSAVADRFITGIAGKTGFSGITVTKDGMSLKVGEYKKILEVFQKHNINVHYTFSGIDCYSVIVESTALEKRKYQILSDLQTDIEPDALDVSENLAVLAVVGRRMSGQKCISGRIFAALGESDINIRLISQGPEELNIIIGVEEQDYAPAIRALYKKFMK